MILGLLVPSQVFLDTKIWKNSDFNATNTPSKTIPKFRDKTIGNIRLWVSDLDNDGIIKTSSEILQSLPRNLGEKHYYPFGMAMEGPWMQSGANNPYQYNGKELVGDFGLNLMDYGARWYDAAVGRWWSVDPLGEEMSAWSGYNYTFNNPIIHTDPKGESPWKIAKGLYNVGKRTYKTYSKTGKVNLNSIKKAGADEVLSIVDNVSTIVDSESSWGEKGLAAFDLVTGFGGEAKAAGKTLGIGKSVKEQAQEIKKTIGNKNTVTVKVNTKGTKNGKEVKVKEIHYDLDGPTHKGVETPHVQRGIENTNPITGDVNINKDKSKEGVRSMNQQDIRTVKKVLQKRNN